LSPAIVKRRERAATLAQRLAPLNIGLRIDQVGDALSGG